MKIILEKLPKISLKELGKYEEYLKRHNAQIKKLNKKLYTRKERLLRLYPDELIKIANKQKRIIKKRETNEKIRDNDYFRYLIDQDVPILFNDDDNEKNNMNEVNNNEKNYNEKYILIEFTPEQYNELQAHIYYTEAIFQFSKISKY